MHRDEDDYSQISDKYTADEATKFFEEKIAKRRRDLEANPECSDRGNWHTEIYLYEFAIEGLTLKKSKADKESAQINLVNVIIKMLEKLKKEIGH